MSTTKGDPVQPHGTQDPERQPLIPTPGGTAQKPPDFGSTGTKDVPVVAAPDSSGAGHDPETAGPTTGTPSAGSTRPVPFQKGSNGAPTHCYVASSPLTEFDRKPWRIIR
jgi:hypothetical protein